MSPTANISLHQCFRFELWLRGKFAVGGKKRGRLKTHVKLRRFEITNHANIGLKLLNLLELTFVFRNVLVFCHFFLEKKVTKNSRLCRNPAILPGRYGGSEKNSPF
jgi:hypothetical protein